MPFVSKDLLFYAVPKTGSTWCLRGLPDLVPLRDHHGTPDGVSAAERMGRFEFCFVRHPVTWLRSYWCDRIGSFGVCGPDTRRLRAAHDGSLYPLDHLLAPTFEGFCQNVLEEHPEGYVTKLFQSFVGPYADGMDFIGRQEVLVMDLAKLLRVALGTKRAQVYIEPWFSGSTLERANAATEESKAGAVLSDATTKAVLEAEWWVLYELYDQAGRACRPGSISRMDRG